MSAMDGQREIAMVKLFSIFGILKIGGRFGCG
jgi:hypothetical protein